MSFFISLAYVANWESCPSSVQVDAYSHIIVAFGVTYTYDAGGNICDPNCSIGPAVDVCGNAVSQAQVDAWRAAGKKVILSFGGKGMTSSRGCYSLSSTNAIQTHLFDSGAGMGRSLAGDLNNCWDYCK